MSHFSVLVTGNDIESALAPFQENNMGDCPKQYLAFHDVEEENRAKYDNESTTRIVMPDGRLLLPWDDEFRKPGMLGTGGGSHEEPAHLERREVPFKETYPTFEQFMSDWCGHEYRDAETGRYGYWENPNWKWDWYSVGGRWGGSLKLKPGADGARGRMRWDSPTDVPEGCVDSARAGDVDWLAMIGEAAVKAREDFRRVTAALAPHARPMTWGELRVKHNDDIEAVRDEFHAQPGVAAVKAALVDRAWGWSDIMDGVLAFNGDEQAYVDFMSLDRSRHYALLHEGKWHEPGEMGWFGFSSETLESRKEYTKLYWNIVLKLDPDTLVTVVDCHI
jgi:hypothetical protein